MKLTRSQIILITGVVMVIVLAGISVPVGIYLYNQSHDEGNQVNDNSTTTSSGTTTTPGPVKAKIITDLEDIEDTLKKFSDDVATLLTRPKLFREEVEHFKTSTIPFFEAIEAESESNTTTSSSTSTSSTIASNTTSASSTKTSSTTSSSTISTSTTMLSTTTSPGMSDFENLTEIMDGKLQLVNNITDNILDHQPLTNLMDGKLQALNSNFSQLDQKMIDNITLSDSADIDLAHILIGKFNVTLNNVKTSLHFLQDVKSSSVSTTTSTMTTSQTFESLAVSKLKVMNETFDIMIEKLAEMVHSSTKLKFKNDQFSQIYDNSLTIIQSLNDTQSNINVTHGIITQNLLNNITNLQNQTSILSNQLQSMTNLTAADEDLAVELIARITGAQRTIGGIVDVIQQQKTTPSTPSSSTKSNEKPNHFNQDMFQRLARRKQRRGGGQQPSQSS